MRFVLKIAWRIAVDLRIKMVTGGLRLAVFCVVRLVTSMGGTVVRDFCFSVYT